MHNELYTRYTHDSPIILVFPYQVLSEYSNGILAIYQLEWERGMENCKLEPRVLWGLMSHVDFPIFEIFPIQMTDQLRVR